jgi:hypothetical protein
MLIDFALRKSAMKPRRRLNPIRSKPRTRVEATVRALRMAWAWHANTTAWRRTL